MLQQQQKGPHGGTLTEELSQASAEVQEALSIALRRLEHGADRIVFADMGHQIIEQLKTYRQMIRGMQASEFWSGGSTEAAAPSARRTGRISDEAARHYPCGG